MRHAAAALLLLGATLISFTAWAEQRPVPAPSSLQIIVHPNNPIQRLERRFVMDAFLKRVERWPDGEQIVPVDLAPSSALRASFAESVLHRPLVAVRMHWQQIIFSGRGVPPPELDSEAAVVRFVLRHRGAIGYVSGNAQLDGARAVASY